MVIDEKRNLSSGHQVMGIEWQLLLAMASIAFAALVKIPALTSSTLTLAPVALLLGLVWARNEAQAGLLVASFFISIGCAGRWGKRLSGGHLRSAMAGLGVVASWTLLTFAVGFPGATADQRLRLAAAAIGGLCVGFAAMPMSNGDQRARVWLRRKGLWDMCMVYLAVTSGVLVGWLWASTGLVAAAISAIPYAITHRLYGSYIRALEIECIGIRAVALLPEAGGLVHRDHVERARRLAVAIGSSVGIGGDAKDELEQAALLHEVGLLCANSSTDHVGGFSAADVARWGSEILSSSSRLAAVSTIVASQAQSFRVPGAEPDPKLDLRAQIVQASCSLEYLLSRRPTSEEAIVEFRLLSSFQISPDVVGVAEVAASVLQE